MNTWNMPFYQNQPFGYYCYYPQIPPFAHYNHDINQSHKDSTLQFKVKQQNNQPSLLKIQDLSAQNLLVQNTSQNQKEDSCCQDNLGEKKPARIWKKDVHCLVKRCRKRYSSKIAMRAHYRAKHRKNLKDELQYKP